MGENKNEKETIVINSKIIDDDKNTQLHYYAAEGKIDKLNDSSIDRQKIDIENYLGWTPLMMASKNGHKEVIKFLLNLGADPSRKNRFGMSVFHIGIASCKLDTVQTLLEHLLCGGISKRSLQNVFSPLSLSILFRNPEVFEYLIGQKFDINAVTPYIGITPLMFAAAMEDFDAYALLLKNGADTAIKNHNGLTAQDIKDKKSIIEEPKSSKPLTPAEMISQSPHMNPFQNVQVLLTPQHNFFNFGLQSQIRKSSNVLTPSPHCYITSPHLTPVSPLNLLPQVFFSPDYYSGHVCSSNLSPYLYPFNNTPELLNARINQSNFIWSPNTNNLSPCM